MILVDATLEFFKKGILGLLANLRLELFNNVTLANNFEKRYQ